MSDLQLETPRLCLRLMRASDLDDLLLIFGDPQVMVSFGVAPFNRAQMEGWIRRQQNGHARLFRQILLLLGQKRH